MKITKTKLPINSILNNSLNSYDYIDSFEGGLTDSENKLKAIDTGRAFFSSSPKWVDILFALRNKIVSLFGLKTSGEIVDRQKQLEEFTFEPGKHLGFFKVYSKSDNEIVIGEDDKHLNFRVSLFLDQSPTDQSKKVLTISTTVDYNNWFGRLYFLPVRPFHKFIVPNMLRRIIKELEK